MPVSVPTKLKHTNGINEVGIEIKDVNNNIVSTGVERDLSEFAVLSLLFGGPNKSVPFKVKVQSTIGLKPGVYTANMNIKWFYHVNAVGLLGIGLITYDSPGFLLNLIGLLGVANWGTGTSVTIPLTLTVEEDCIISTNNINFGSAAFTSQFNPVTGTVQIKCSAQTPYNVGLSDGNHFNVTRRLKHSSQDIFIGYEVYKNSTTNRWGVLNTERWNSDAATANPSNYDAVTQQSYSFTSKILNPSNTVFPEGIYSDILQVDVRF
jgi:spore coat protein U-like protein